MFEHCDVNPYQTPQSCRVDEERRSKRTVFLRLFVGTLIGVSTHWVLLWTDTLSTEMHLRAVHYSASLRCFAT